MAQRARDSFPGMVELRIQKEGATFKDIRRATPPELVGRPVLGPSLGGEEKDDEIDN